MTDPAAPWSDTEARALHARLLASGQRVAVAESLTVGHVQAALGRLSGASAYFAGGVTTYSTAAKIHLLGVDAPHATSVNAVSERVALEMARGAARLFACEFGLATTGYAEPDPTHHIPAPFAWVAAIHGPRELTACIGGADLARTDMQAAAAVAALRLLAELLADHSPATPPTP